MMGAGINKWLTRHHPGAFLLAVISRNLRNERVAVATFVLSTKGDADRAGGYPATDTEAPSKRATGSDIHQRVFDDSHIGQLSATKIPVDFGEPLFARRFSASSIGHEK